MGSLPVEQAGVGSAVNDTTRELGGTLGVAIVGSVFSSAFGPRIAAACAGLAAPPEALRAARESVAAALTIANQAPAEIRGPLVAAARVAFMDGMTAGCRITAGAAFAGALVALKFLPARAGAERAKAEVASSVSTVGD